VQFSGQFSPISTHFANYVRSFHMEEGRPCPLGFSRRHAAETENLFSSADQLKIAGAASVTTVGMPGSMGRGLPRTKEVEPETEEPAA